MRALAVLSLLLTVSGCATAPFPICRGSQQGMLVADMLFGRKIGDGGTVTRAAWSGFLAREITPRFPDGVTVVDASGQWRDPERGDIVREPSKLVMIVFRDTPEAQERLAAITETYKRAFRQRSVGVVIRPACASF